MAYEIKIDEEIIPIELISVNENIMEFNVGGRKYKVDAVQVEKGVYSIIYNGISYNVELINKSRNSYHITTLYNSVDIDIIDAEERYKNSRKSHDDDDDEYISTPMPGKVVKILVKDGDSVKGGETVIIVSAMKMESEYKVKKDRHIKKVLVSEGDNIEGNQPLILLD